MNSILSCFRSKKEIPTPTTQPVRAKERYVHVIQHAASDAMVAAPAAWRDMDQSLVKNELLRHQMSRQGSRTDLLSTRPVTPSRTPSPGQSPVLSPYGTQYLMGMRSLSDNGRGPHSSTSGSYSTTTRSHLHKVTNHSDEDDADNEASPSASSSGSGSAGSPPLSGGRFAQKEKFRAAHRPWPGYVEGPHPRTDIKNIIANERFARKASSDSGFASSSSSSAARERQLHMGDRRLHVPVPMSRPAVNRSPYVQQMESSVSTLQLPTSASSSSSALHSSPTKSSGSDSSNTKMELDSDTISEISTSFSTMSSAKRYKPHRKSFSRPRPIDLSSLKSTVAVDTTALETQSVTGLSIATTSRREAVTRKAVPLRSTKSSPNMKDFGEPSSPCSDGGRLRMPPPPWMVERSIRSHQLFTQPMEPQPMLVKGKRHMYDQWINTSAGSVPTLSSTRQVYGLPSPTLTEDSAGARRALGLDLGPTRDASVSPLNVQAKTVKRSEPVKETQIVADEIVAPVLVNNKQALPEAPFIEIRASKDGKIEPVSVSVVPLPDNYETPAESPLAQHPQTKESQEHSKTPQIQISTVVVAESPLTEQLPQFPQKSLAPDFSDRRVLQRDSFNIIHPAWNILT